MIRNAKQIYIATHTHYNFRLKGRSEDIINETTMNVKIVEKEARRCFGFFK